jgi:hypothetical protein
MNRAVSYRVLGRSGRDDYLAMPFTRRGRLLFHTIRWLMPVINAKNVLAMKLQRGPGTPASKT